MVLWQSVFKVSNVAVTVLLRFLSLFLHYLANITELKSMEVLANVFPDTLPKAQRVAKLNRDDFKKYVCCPKCFAIYDMKDCFDKVGTQEVPRSCCSAKFPRHPWMAMRGVCGSTLLKAVKTSQRYKPIKVYCCKSITSSIAAIISRPGMSKACESWRDRHVLQDVWRCVQWAGVAGFYNLRFFY